MTWAPGAAKAIAWACGLFLAAYAVPEILMHLLGLCVLTSTRKRGEVAITFNDGPDPVFTPAVLDTLRDRGLKATFFVLGKKAADHPDIMERMAREGHEVAIHGWDHRHPWLMGPITCVVHLRRSLDLTRSYRRDTRPKYRPCWGFWSLWLVAATRPVDRVMWSVPGGDWKRGATPESVTRNVLNGAKGGDIVLLHDGGRYSWITVRALPAILDALSSKGLRQVTVEELRRSS